MKVTLALLLPAAITSAAVLEPRQGRQPATQYKYTTKTLTPKFRQNSQRTFTRIGPLKLQGGLSGRHGISLDSNGQGITWTIPKSTFCGGQDCTIIAGQSGLEFANGTKADVSKGVYIHHILGTNQKKKVDPFVSRCDSSGDIASVKMPGKSNAGFVGGSDDNIDEPMVYGTKDGSVEGGYWLGKEDSIGVWADLVNLDKEDKELFLTYDLEYMPGHVGADAQGSLISVTGCGGRRIATPMSGPANTTSGKFKFFRDGYLVNGSTLVLRYRSPRNETVLFANRYD